MATMGEIKRINKTEEILARLTKEGKVTKLEWSAEQWKEWNDKMDEIRRESRYKQAMSEIEASKTWIF